MLFLPYGLIQIGREKKNREIQAEAVFQAALLGLALVASYPRRARQTSCDEMR